MQKSASAGTTRRGRWDVADWASSVPASSALTWARMARRWADFSARSWIRRRSVTSRKYTDKPSGLGQARSSYQPFSGAG